MAIWPHATFHVEEDVALGVRRVVSRPDRTSAQRGRKTLGIDRASGSLESGMKSLPGDLIDRCTGGLERIEECFEG